MKKIIPVLALVFLIMNACAPAQSQPTLNPPGANPPPTNVKTAVPTQSKPMPNNSNFTRGNAYLESAELLTLESAPPQFTLALKGSLPTPCNQLRVEVAPPDSEHKIIVEVYSVTSPNMICVQVMEPFEENFALGSFAPGKYTLWVNGAMIAEFET